MSNQTNEYVNRILREHLPRILNSDRVAVPDDEEEMNWRIFFAHSQDMQGFRSDIFTDGPNEDVHPFDRAFVALRPRWGRDSRSFIADLASVWDDQAYSHTVRVASNPFRSGEEKKAGVVPLVELLIHSVVEGAVVFAETLLAFKGDKIARKTNKMIRAYLQNASLLREHHDCSFRHYLMIPSAEGWHRRTWILTSGGG